MIDDKLSKWAPIWTPSNEPAPVPITVRAQSLPERSYFPEHRHDWGQVVYALSGVLTIWTEGRSFVISPDQAVWVPPGVIHRVGTLLGAEFRSLWIAAGAVCGLVDEATVFAVPPLMKALIVEVAELSQRQETEAYGESIAALILDQLRRVEPLPGALPWPKGVALNALCQALYADPADQRTEEAWGRELGMSGRTLRRRFLEDVGMSLRSWLRQMRLFKAIELLGGGMDVTRTALELGYSSSSAFIYAFRTAMGISPHAYRSGKS